MRAAFVGRRAELEALTSVPRQARESRGGAAAVVMAPPGSGKTRLLAEVARRISQESIARLVGYQPVQAVPLAAVGDLLRELGVSPAESDPARIFEGAHQARIVAGMSVLLIDDLQWLDSLSLGLVHYLLRAAASSRHSLAVIAAGRPSGEVESFRGGAAAILGPELILSVELLPLGIADGVALARSVRPDLDEQQARVLWQRAQGSPFWLEALAIDRGDDRSDVISSRVAGLGMNAAAVVSALAVGGRPLVEAELAEILEWPLERVRQTTDELVVRGTLIWGAGGIRFAHDLIREMAVGEVPPATVLRIHRRFALWIEGLPQADLGLLREALEHRAAAGMPTAELVLRLLASPDRRLLGAAGLHLIAGIADSLGRRSPHRESLAQGVAELASSLGEQEVAVEWWSRVSAESRTSELRKQAELAAAVAGYRLGRADLARTHLDLARDAGREPPSAEGHEAELEDLATAIEMHALDARLYLWLEHRTSEGAAAAVRAITSARKMAAAAGGLRALSTAGMRAYLLAVEAASDAATQQARMADLLPLAREIEQLAGLLEDDATSVQALTRAGSSLQQLGGSPEAAALLRRAWVLAKERILPAESDEAGHWLARSLLGHGRLADALAIASETADLEARLGHGSRHWGRADRLVHAIELSTGDPRAALVALRADAAREQDRHHELGIRQTIAEWQARYSGASAVADIDAQLAVARAASSEVACPRCGHELAIVDTEIQARLGRIAEAEAGIARWRPTQTSRQWGEPLWRFRAEGAVALARRDPDAAVAAARGAVAECRRFGYRLLEIWGLIDLGRAYSLEDRTAAVGTYEQAAAISDQIGARSEGRLIARELRRLGVRTWRRAAGDPAGATSRTQASSVGNFGELSGREREIAGRVATGATNAEIAEALVISPKTVERHVTNIFAKLGIRNRAELTSLVRGSPDDLPGVAS